MQDWNNIDLNSSFEADLNIIDPLSFSTLLLEVNCNVRVIDEKSVTDQFETDLQNRVEEAREIFRANLANITKHAQSARSNH